MKRVFSRRAFLQGSAAAAGGLAVAKTISLEAAPLPRAVAPSDRVRFGMIGVGMQGSGLLGQAITIPGIECVAAADFVRRPAHTGERDHVQSKFADHTEISGAAGSKRH